MRWVVIVVALSACGRVGFDGVVVDAIVVADADATMCAGPNDDDQDGVADECDTCPHLAGAQSDSDGDGVGDICDPFATATESLAKFEPFLVPLDATWMSSSPAPFTVSGSALHVNSAGLGGTWMGYGVDPARSEVTMRGDVDAVGGGPHQVSIQFGTGTLPGAEYCEYYDGPNPTFKITRSDGAGTFDTLASMVVPPLPAGPYAMSFGHAASGFRCSLTMNGITYDIASPETFSTARNFASLQFIDVDASVESLAEIQTAP